MAVGLTEFGYPATPDFGLGTGLLAVKWRSPQLDGRPPTAGLFLCSGSFVATTCNWRE
jgi:hypothetical protein